MARKPDGDSTSYLEHHLGDITMKVMAQLGKKRLNETVCVFFNIASQASPLI